MLLTLLLTLLSDALLFHHIIKILMNNIKIYARFGNLDRYYDTKYYLIFKHIDMLLFQFQNLLSWNSCTSYGIEKMCRIYHHLF